MEALSIKEALERGFTHYFECGDSTREFTEENILDSFALFDDSQEYFRLAEKTTHKIDVAKLIYDDWYNYVYNSELEDPPAFYYEMVKNVVLNDYYIRNLIEQLNRKLNKKIYDSYYMLRESDFIVMNPEYKG